MKDGIAVRVAEHILAVAGCHDRGTPEPALWEPLGSRATWLLDRPSLPPLFFVACGVWGGVAFVVEACFLLGQTWWFTFVCACAAAFVLAFACFGLERPLIACLLLGMALGGITGCAHCREMLVQSQSLLHGGGVQTVQVVRDARAGEFGASALAQTDDGALVRLNFPDECEALVGERITFDAQWKEPSAKMRQAYWLDGIVAVARVRSYEALPDDGPLAMVRSVRAQALQMVSSARTTMQDGVGIDLEEAALLLRAVDVGYVDGLYTSELYQAVKIDGLAHLVAVSGAHLAIVCGAVALALGRTGLTRGVAVLLQVAIILCYLIFTGAPISAIRASIMASLGLLSYLPGRRPYALGALSACVIAMLALMPRAAFSASFVLSVAATAGIVIFMPYFQQALQCIVPARLNALSDSIALTIAATIITAPVSACRFGQLSLAAPIANVLAAPLFPVLCIGGFLAIAMCLLTGGACMVGLHGMLVIAHACTCLFEAISHIPYASIPVSLDVASAFVFALGIPVALWIAWPRPGPWMLGAFGCAIAASLTCCALFPLVRGDVVTVLDIGQGDAILVQSAGRAMLIDTGTDDTALLQELAACGVQSLDAVLISHPDDDHCGSLAALRGVVRVDQVLVAADLLQEDNEHCAKLRSHAATVVGEDGIVGLSVGQQVSVGHIAFEVVGPDAFADGGGNADSLVMVMRYDADADGVAELSGLFTGDAEAPEIDRYIAQGRIGDVDLYKVAHHGSAGAVDAQLLDVTKPEVSVISVGAGNRYGHPVPATIEALECEGSAVYRTDMQGTITCFLRPDGIHVRSEG